MVFLAAGHEALEAHSIGGKTWLTHIRTVPVRVGVRLVARSAEQGVSTRRSRFTLPLAFYQLAGLALLGLKIVLAFHSDPMLEGLGKSP
jgi:hypothetical protein